MRRHDKPELPLGRAGALEARRARLAGAAAALFACCPFRDRPVADVAAGSTGFCEGIAAFTEAAFGSAAVAV
jgi:hypothetical protein